MLVEMDRREAAISTSALFQVFLHSEFIKNNKSEIIVQLNCDHKDVHTKGQWKKKYSIELLFMT